MDEETRKRAGNDEPAELNKKPKTSDLPSEENDEDDASDELVKLLDAAEEASPCKVKFIDDPYSSPLIFRSSSSYLTINGNEESCGSSFSDSDSSVMASVDMTGFNVSGEKAVAELGKWLESILAEDDGASGKKEEGAGGGRGKEGFEGVLGKEEGEDTDGIYVDDDALARFWWDDLFQV